MYFIWIERDGEEFNAYGIGHRYHDQADAEAQAEKLANLFSKDATISVFREGSSAGINWVAPVWTERGRQDGDL